MQLLNFLTYLMSFATRSDRASKCIHKNKQNQRIENKFYKFSTQTAVVDGKTFHLILISEFSAVV